MKKNNNKSVVIVIVVFIVLMAGCFKMCSDPKPTFFKTKGLPTGVEITDFQDDYDVVHGQHTVKYSLVNRTGKQIIQTAVGATFYKDGVLNGPTSGGCFGVLGNNESCSGKVSWLLPDGRADSIIFTFDGVIK